MLTAQDISGVYVLAPTPCAAGAETWGASGTTVDLAETESMVENLIAGGVGGISLCGTLGESAALLFEEKRQFYDVVVQVARKRVPIFGGTTALGTRETINQMRAVRDVGIDGAFVGLPFWQKPTIGVALRWFKDLSEAVPDLPIMIYSNSRVFRFAFPKEFWFELIRLAPTVITNKITSEAIMRDLEEVVERTGQHIAHLPNERQAVDVWRRVGGRVRGLWSTSGNEGPEPVVALSDAINENDEARVESISKDIQAVPHYRPKESEMTFDELETQVQKARFVAAGFINPGHSRAPYSYEDLPPEWVESSTVHARAWAEMRKKYAGVSASRGQ